MTDWIWAATEATLGLLKPRPRLPQHNLQQYARTAVLPSMILPAKAPALPPPGSKSHKNTLQVQHESYRNLECMHKVDAFDQLVMNFNQLNIPSTSVQDPDEADDVAMTVPAPNFEIHPCSLRKPADLQRLLTWVTDYPLQTVTRMMYLAYPETANYVIQDDFTVGGAGKELMRWVKWAPDPAVLTSAAEFGKPTVTIFVQPPWILSPRDLEVFASSRTFPNPLAHWKSPLKSHARLWAKIWDTCAHNRSHWFVLTTYWGWVFGSFSRERSQAWTSGVIPWDSSDPTVIECLVFWFACATVRHQALFGPWEIPEVSEPIDVISDLDLVETPEDVHMEIVPSESDDWEVRSRLTARSRSPSGYASDDDEGTVILQLTDEAVQALPRLPQNMKPAAITRWQTTVQKVAPPAVSVREGSPMPSESAITMSSATTESSVSTLRDYGEEEKHVGSWLNTRVEFEVTMT